MPSSPRTLARQASHPSAGDKGAPPAGGNLAVAVPHEGAVGLFIVPEETRPRMPDELVDGRPGEHITYTQASAIWRRCSRPCEKRATDR